MILVTGATGTNGAEVVKRLLATTATSASGKGAGPRVRALVRDPEKARQRGLNGVDLARGDLADVASLRTAMEGVEALFLLCPVDARQVELERNAIEAAQAAGVGRIVKFSAFHAARDSPSALLRCHFETEERIRGTGIPFTFLRPNMFMQELLRQSETIRTQGAFWLPLGELRVSLVDVRDIADVATAALTQPGHEGKTYEITGPTELSFEEVAEALSVVAGRTITYIPASMGAFREGFLNSGAPAWMVERVAELYGTFEGKNDIVRPGVVEALGRPAGPIAAFARDHAAAFRPS